MTKQKLTHILGLLGTIAIPLLTVWGDAGTELPVKIALILAALSTLATGLAGLAALVAPNN